MYYNLFSPLIYPMTVQQVQNFLFLPFVIYLPVPCFFQLLSSNETYIAHLPSPVLKALVSLVISFTSLSKLSEPTFISQRMNIVCIINLQMQKLFFFFLFRYRITQKKNNQIMATFLILDFI